MVAVPIRVVVVVLGCLPLLGTLPRVEVERKVVVVQQERGEEPKGEREPIDRTPRLT